MPPNPSAGENQQYDRYQLSFAGVEKLFGKKAFAHLKTGHFCVIGLGGVGSWAAEALARSGVGKISLIDLDEVCVSNTNRQSHALSSNVGRSKVECIAERLQDINPEIELSLEHAFITKQNASSLVSNEMDVVIDAIDATHIKTALAAYCSAAKIRLVTVGSSGGKTDPRLVCCDDLARTVSDPMLAKIRSQLYRQYNFSRDKQRKFRIDAIYSTQAMVYPQPCGEVSMDKKYIGEGTKLDCASGFGSSVMVTGTFGFLAAQVAIERYLKIDAKKSS